MTAPTRLLTYEELRELPDLGERYELIDGVLVVPASPVTAHVRVMVRLVSIFVNHLTPLRRQNFLFFAPYDVRLTEFRAVQPDLLYVDPDGPPRVTTGYLDGAPDLVVEVLSPSNRSHDLLTKFGFYAEAGVREYWIIDPENETFTLFLLDEDSYVEQPITGGVARSVVLPGLEVDLDVLFADLQQGFPE